MAAETLGVDYNQVRAIVADTGSIGYTHVTGGSRVTFATGMAVVDATKNVIKDLHPPRRDDLGRRPRGRGLGRRLRQAGGRQRGRLQADVAGGNRRQGGGDGRSDHRLGRASTRALRRRGSAAHFVDVEVDPETGRVDILKYVAAQDVGKAIHPSYVEGQIQGGVVQGIGWALNEEYIYNAKGQLDNAGFLDYRCPVASDIADDRHHPGRGAEPGASVRRQGRRRGEHLPADGRHRQCDRVGDARPG